MRAPSLSRAGSTGPQVKAARRARARSMRPEPSPCHRRARLARYRAREDPLVRYPAEPPCRASPIARGRGRPVPLDRAGWRREGPRRSRSGRARRRRGTACGAGISGSGDPACRDHRQAATRARRVAIRLWVATGQGSRSPAPPRPRREPATAGSGTTARRGGRASGCRGERGGEAARARSESRRIRTAGRTRRRISRPPGSPIRRADTSAERPPRTDRRSGCALGFRDRRKNAGPWLRLRLARSWQRHGGTARAPGAGELRRLTSGGRSPLPPCSSRPLV